MNRVDWSKSCEEIRKGTRTSKVYPSMWHTCDRNKRHRDRFLSGFYEKYLHLCPMGLEWHVNCADRICIFGWAVSLIIKKHYYYYSIFQIVESMKYGKHSVWRIRTPTGLYYYEWLYYTVYDYKWFSLLFDVW